MSAPHYEERPTWRTQPSAVGLLAALCFLVWSFGFAAGRVAGWW